MSYQLFWVWFYSVLQGMPDSTQTFVLSMVSTCVYHSNIANFQISSQWQFRGGPNDRFVDRLRTLTYRQFVRQGLWDTPRSNCHHPQLFWRPHWMITFLWHSAKGPGSTTSFIFGHSELQVSGLSRAMYRMTIRLWRLFCRSWERCTHSRYR